MENIFPKKAVTTTLSLLQWPERHCFIHIKTLHKTTIITSCEQLAIVHAVVQRVLFFGKLLYTVADNRADSFTLSLCHS